MKQMWPTEVYNVRCNFLVFQIRKNRNTLGVITFKSKIFVLKAPAKTAQRCRAASTPTCVGVDVQVVLFALLLAV